ncbi:suppressor of cytokine signaling 4-like [Polyodon spathula]|uniref:suppressor of cytokine signaling 4-like n=1 Tax=Polyodon spathula TaxID=7913 RepID=UPI001B7E3165|nr:suppressor of cytokine signaling 4-like [Polyodon spathula]
MSDKKARNPDARPKSNRSRSLDSYVWSRKKRSRNGWNEPTTPIGCSEGEGAELSGRIASCPQRLRERRYSSSSAGDPDCDSSRKALSGRSFRQTLQDAMVQCFPLRTHHQTGASRPFSKLLWSKRKIHVSELMQDKCPFSPKSELAQCWHLIKRHSSQHPGSGGEHESKGEQTTSTPLLISWEEISSQSLGRNKQGVQGGEMEDSNEDRVSLCTFPGLGSRSGDAVCSLVPDLLQINNSSCYWGVLDRYQAEELLDGKPEGTFLLRDSAQDDFLFSVSFRRYSRSLHARIEHRGQRFSFDERDPCVYQDPSVTGLLQHYSDPAACLFFEPLLSLPLPRTFPFSLQHLSRAVISSCTTYQGVDSLPLPPSLKDYLRQYHYKHRTGAECS